MKVLFLDESGDHNLSIIDPQYPLFVLGGVIVDRDYAEGSLQLADLVASPIGRHLLGKVDKADWRIVERKLRRNHVGEVEGFGLVVLPK